VTTCACGAAVDGAYLCRACTERLTVDLVTAASIGAELDTAMARLAVMGDRGGHGSFSHPLPVDLRAAEAARELAGVLAATGRLLGAWQPVPVTRGHSAVSRPSESRTEPRPAGEG
jgi:hypothetical protein